MPQFKPYLQNQGQLLPPSLDEMLAQDHLARLINHAIDKMDLSAIENTYSSNGQHAYHPKRNKGLCIAHNLKKIQKRIQRTQELGQLILESRQVQELGQILGYVPAFT